MLAWGGTIGLMSRTHTRAAASFVLLLLVFVVGSASAQTTAALDSGEAVYRAACAACHGRDGRGLLQLSVGFDLPLPDFTDCSFNSREPDRKSVV